MSTWITDRLPTREDADLVGDVTYCNYDGEVFNLPYDQILLGNPWMTPTYPEPYVKPKVWDWYNWNSDVVVIRKNGYEDYTSYQVGTFTNEQLDAMIDALNRLEEGV